MMKGKDTLSIAGRSALAEFVVDAKEALRFQLVRRPEEVVEVGVEEKEEDEANGGGGDSGGLDVGRTFQPDMAHQVYGEQENIFGYRNLHVDLLMSCGGLKAFLDMKSDDTINPEAHDGIGPDPVLPPLVQLLAPGQLAKSMDEFKAYLREEETKFAPMGEKIHDWTTTPEDGKKERHFEMFHCDASISGFSDYHSRLQPWIMFYIDAASYIDIDDDHWRFFLMYEKFNLDGQTRYAIAGYTTVYHYYAYPSNVRPRISQMLVLPPFQRRGLGAKMLETVQRYYWKNTDVVDITVEDPSDEFIRLRDFVDAKNCLKLKSFQEDSLKKGFSPEMAQEAKESYKLCKKQARKIYEILRLKCTKQKDAQEYKSYRVDVKQRLNAPYMKEDRQLEKLRKVLKPEEFTAATLNITNRDQRLDSLQAQYQELEEHYLQVLERMAES